MSHYHVYGLGAALVDTEIEIDDNELSRLGVDKGLMTLVDEPRQDELVAALEGHLVYSRRASGGSAANTVIAATYFGARTYYSCRVADDENGRFYLNDLREAGVATRRDGNPDGGITGKCLVLITPDAERSMNTFLGISATLAPEDLNKEALAASDYFYAEGYLATSDSGRAAVVEARQCARENGVKVALSLSDPGIVEHFKPQLQEMLGDGVDMLFCNRDEALGWTGCERLEDAVEALRGVAGQFAVTLGADGALVFDGQRTHRIDPVKVKAVDTNGAGDIYAGAFIYGLTHGLGYEGAGRLASRAAAKLITRFGARLPFDEHKALLS